MRTLWLALLCFSATALVAQDARIEEVGKSPVEAKFAAGGKVRMDLCPGGIELVGKDEGRVRVSYHPERDDVKVRLEVAGSQAESEGDGMPAQ